MQSYSLDDKVRAVKAVAEFYKTDRLFYLWIAAASAIVLLGLATYGVLSNKIGWNGFFTLFVPGGSIGYSSGKILSYFEKSIDLLKEKIK